MKYGLTVLKPETTEEVIFIRRKDNVPCRQWS